MDQCFSKNASETDCDPRVAAEAACDRNPESLCSFGQDRRLGSVSLHIFVPDHGRAPLDAIRWRPATRLALLLILAVGGCRAEEQQQTSKLPADALYNSIEEAREAKPVVKADPRRLGVLAPGDIPEDLRHGSACRLVQGDRLLLHAAASGAVARIDGRPLRLRIAGPVGPSGGFFNGSGVTISVGRQVAPVGEGYEPPAPATASISNTRDAGIQHVNAMWACLPVPTPLPATTPAAAR
jgi:hypothetical protein